MTQKPKIYLDTSVPSAYYDDRKPDRQEETRAFWKKLQHYEVVISTLVEAELEGMADLDPERATKTLALVERFRKVDLTEEANTLAEGYLKAKAFRKGALTDARHVAIATVERAYCLVSWNYRDLVNLRARAKIHAVNIDQGYLPLEIISPPELG